MPERPKGMKAPPRNDTPPPDQAPAPRRPAGGPRWEHFQHDADIGVRGFGPTREEALAQAALSLTAVVTDPDGVRPLETVEMECEAPDDSLLLAEWLNTLVYEMDRRRMLFREFDIRLENHRLRAVARGEKVDVRRHEPAVEVKGATYTELRMERGADGAWVAQCVVDV